MPDYFILNFKTLIKVAINTFLFVCLKVLKSLERYFLSLSCLNKLHGHILIEKWWLVAYDHIMSKLGRQEKLVTTYGLFGSAPAPATNSMDRRSHIEYISSKQQKSRRRFKLKS
jgi:hypothetical protein